MEKTSKESVYGFMRGYNKVEGFNPENAAIQAVSVYNGYTNEIQILPADVKKAWFRMIYPQGHTEDEQFGVCDDKVANVKVTVFATGDRTQELSHAYASKVFDPTSASDAIIPEASRALYLYRTAVGMAKSTALTEAGIGMGYYQNVREAEEAAKEGLDTVTTKTVCSGEDTAASVSAVETVSRTAIEGTNVSVPAAFSNSKTDEVHATTEAEPTKVEAPDNAKARSVRRSAAEVVEEKMNLLSESIEKMNELTEAINQEGVTEALRAELKSSLGKEELSAMTYAEYVERQISKAERNNNRAVLNVVSREYFENAISNAPIGSNLRTVYISTPEVKAEAASEAVKEQMIETVSEEPTHQTAEHANETEVYQMNLALDDSSEEVTELVKEATKTTDPVELENDNYRLSSSGIGKYANTLLSELALDELKLLLVKATRGILNEEDTAHTIARIRADFPDQVEVCKRRCPELFS